MKSLQCNSKTSLFREAITAVKIKQESGKPLHSCKNYLTKCKENVRKKSVARRGPDILMNVLKDYIIFFVWAVWIFIFILSKNKGFQSGALQKMATSFPSMEEFCLDIQK